LRRVFPCGKIGRVETMNNLDKIDNLDKISKIDKLRGLYYPNR